MQPAFADDASRLATARQVVELSGVGDALNRMTVTLKPLFVAGVQQNGQISQADAEHLGDLFVGELHNSMPQMLDAVAVAYAHEFTDDQLTAIRDFFRSPAGQALRTNQPHLMDELQQVGGRFGQEAAQRAVARLAAEKQAPGANHS